MGQFIWSDRANESLENLKSTLCSAHILGQFIVDADATDNGVSGVLTQRQEGEEKVITYYRKTFNKAERNYCVTRKELLAIVKAIENFHKYLYGKEFLVRTDHPALQ